MHADQLRELAGTVPFDGPTKAAIAELVTSIDDRRQAARDAFATRFAEFDTAKTRTAVARLTPDSRRESA